MRASPARGGRSRPPARLLRLHRHSLSNLLVIGGTPEERLTVARTFHRTGPLGRCTFLAVDCGRDEARLCRALQYWLVPDGTPPASSAEVGCGTLYLDSIGCLSVRAQDLLLRLARRLQCGPHETRSGPGPLRLAAANAGTLDDAVAERRFSGALYDCLDKIRVELGQTSQQGAA